MVTSINQAFNKFSQEVVNIEKSQSDKAKSSRNWLIDNINRFPENDTNFPYLYKECHLNYGSFERKTKTRPLDDIDLMVCLNAEGWSYSTSMTGNILISPCENYIGRLNNFKGNNILDKDLLNSTKILNGFKSNLNNISQYAKAEIKRNGVAVTLKLISYDWNFDIVPCFITAQDILGKSYYLIPNGNGDWKKTDPRIDRLRVQTINQLCNGYVLNVIRLFKYWNQNLYAHSIPSYLLETMICDYYQMQISLNMQSNVTRFLDLEFLKVLDYLINNITYSVPDPKGIDFDINDIGTLKQFQFKNLMERDLDKAEQAKLYEYRNEHVKAFNKWREIFGENFPTYG